MKVTIKLEAAVRRYDPDHPLFSLHIPKCAGQSLRIVLQAFFKEKLYFHYFQQFNCAPPKYALPPGSCIHGHFNRIRGWGVMEYYPNARQFITVLRHPLDAAVSNYFFWKQKGRARQLARGDWQTGSDKDYRDIGDFFHKRPRSNFFCFMPVEMTHDNYKELIEEKFVWIGLVEKFPYSIDHLAGLLGRDRPDVLPFSNQSRRDEDVPDSLIERFLETNCLEIEIYHYVERLSGAQGPFTGGNNAI